MKKRLLSVALLMGTMAANAQVGIGTATPNKSAELLIESNNRGLLIPNVALTTTKDKTTITNGNVQSLLVYATKAQGDITPGYYYWDVNIWKRLTADADIPGIVINKFGDILKGGDVTKLIKNIVKTTEGNVIYEGDKLYHITKDGDKVEINFDGVIKAHETLTVLAFDIVTGALTYSDEKKAVTTIDIKGAVKSFETVTSITNNVDAGTLTFKDETGIETVVSIKDLVKKHETITTLVREEAGKYIYTNEAGTESKITVIGDITEVIKNKTDQDLYNVLKQLVNVEQTLTKLVYNTTSKNLEYTDEKNAIHNIDVDALVKENQTLTTLKGGTNIKVTEVKGANSISYTLDVPTATKEVAGVVKPGSGLDIDAAGNLTVNLETALNGKDLTGNEIIIVTDGKGAVLRETALSVNEKAIKLENLGGTLNLTQLQAGNPGDVLVVDKDGNVIWSAKDIATSNKLELNGTELTSTVNGVSSTQTLKDKLTTEMLKDGSVTAEKLEAGKGNEGKVPVAQADGTVVYQNISSTNVDGKALTSANDLMTVSNTAGVVLKDVVLTIDQTKFELNKIGGTLQLTQIETGGADTVLVTEVGADGETIVKWVSKESIVTANETVTSIVDHGNGTFTYTNEKNVPVTFDANTVKVDVKDGVYTFKNKNKEGENVITTIDTNAIASGYNNTNSGLKAENVQAAIDELVNRLNGTSDSLVDLGNGKYQHTTVDGKVIEFDINTVNVEKVTDAKGNVSYVFKDAEGTAITTISLTGDVVENITKQGDVYDAIINMIKSEEKTTVVAPGTGVTVTPTIDGKVTTYTVSADTSNITLGGDVTGNADNTTISKLQGKNLVTTNVAEGNVLVFEGGQWITKIPTVDASNVGNGKALSSTENTITISANGATSLLKDVQIDVTDGAINEDKLATNAVTSDKIKDGAVTTNKITGGDNGQVLTTTVSTEGKKTVEWKTPTVNTTDITNKGNLTSTTKELLTVKDGDGVVLQNVSLTVNEGNFNISNMKGDLTVNRIEAGNDNQVLATVGTGNDAKVVWTNKDKPVVVKPADGKATETNSNVIVTPGTNPTTGEKEYTVDVKAAMPKVFYMPPVMFDTSKKHNELQTRNLYNEYVAMFGGTGAVVDTPISGDRPPMVQSDASATIPVYKKEDLNFFVPYYDPAVFSDVKVDINGVLTYKVIKKAKYGAFMTVVFVVK